MPDNAADRKSIRRLEKQAAIDAAAHAEVTHNLMSTTQGRAWVWRWLSQCHVFTTTFSGSALHGAFAEGERNIGQLLLNEITSTCPDQFIQAMREANVRDATGERRSSPQPDGRDSRREAGGDASDPYDADRDSEGNPAFDGYAN